MKNKRANESVGMSVNVIFSLFLIVVFISVAFVAIKFFLKMQNTTQIGNFYENLQDEIDNAWSSSGTNRTLSLDLPKKIEYVCFLDFNQSAKGTWANYYNNFSAYIYNDVNLFVYPLSATGDLKYKKIDHIDIYETTKTDNPLCFENPSEIIIQKEVYSRLVLIK